MKRFHVNVAVADLDRSTRFYSTLFGVEPTVRKNDYAKWMLDDPRVNFSLSTSGTNRGINHVGLQADSTEELAEIQSRLEDAGENTLDQPDAECCYAHSTKTWVRDPDGVAWESFVTFGSITRYGDDLEPDYAAEAAKCCAETTETPCCASGD